MPALIIPGETPEQQAARQHKADLEQAQRIFQLAPEDFRQAASLLARYKIAEIKCHITDIVLALLMVKYGFTEEMIDQFVVEISEKLGLAITKNP